MSDATDRSAALKQLTEYAQPDVEPRLGTSGESSELDQILDRWKRATTWVAATAYNVGDMILPATRNGHKYRCVQPGTSAGSSHAYTFWPIRSGSRVSEGTSDPILTWVEDGPDYPNIYDVRAAAYEAWDLKARKASQMIQDGDLRMDQLYDNCIRVRNSFNPAFVV